MWGTYWGDKRGDTVAPGLDAAQRCCAMALNLVPDQNLRPLVDVLGLRLEQLAVILRNIAHMPGHTHCNRCCK